MERFPVFVLFQGKELLSCDFGSDNSDFQNLGQEIFNGLSTRLLKLKNFRKAVHTRTIVQQRYDLSAIIFFFAFVVFLYNNALL